MPSRNFLDYKSIINHVPLNSTNLVTLDKSKPLEQCPLTPLLNALEVNKFSSKNSQKIAFYNLFNVPQYTRVGTSNGS